MANPGFLHTSPVHVAAFDALLEARDPSLQAIHWVDEQLLHDARAHGPEAVRQAVATRLRQLQELGVDAICCTCTTVGAIAEQANVDVPVFRVDRPMAEKAVASGDRIGVVVAVESTIGPTRELLLEAAWNAGRNPTITMELNSGAWKSFESGDQAAYLSAIADSARKLAAHVDVVVLAQASMAAAAELLDGMNILTSPCSAVDRLLELSRAA